VGSVKRGVRNAECGMIRIRQATSSDLSRIIALDREIFGAYGADESPTVIQARVEVFPAGCAVLEEVTEASTKTGEVARFLGYLTTEKWAAGREPVLDEDPRLTHVPTGSILNITTLAIAPQQQQRGLGTQLVEYAVALAKQENCTTIVLETAHAERFYLRHGFVKRGERHQRNILLHILQMDLRKT